MTSKAHVEFDPAFTGVRVAVLREYGYGSSYLTWQQPVPEMVQEGRRESADNAWLRLEDDDARALYEALAEHFGHAGHDIRALRKDYDAERKRVDLFISHLTKGS